MKSRTPSTRKNSTRTTRHRATRESVLRKRIQDSFKPARETEYHGSYTLKNYARTAESWPLLSPEEERVLGHAILDSKAAFWNHLLRTRLALESVLNDASPHSPISSRPALRNSLPARIKPADALFERLQTTGRAADETAFLRALESVRHPLLECEFQFSRIDALVCRLRELHGQFWEIRGRAATGDPSVATNLSCLENALWLCGPELDPYFTRLALLENQLLMHRDRLVQSNLRLAMSLVRDFRTSGMATEDLMQEATIALIHAAESFDTRKARFSTHATRKIHSALQRAIDNQNSLIRVPVYIADQHRKLRKAADVLSTELGREPLPAELAAHCRMDTCRVRETLENERVLRALHMKIRPDQSAALADVQCRDPYQTEEERDQCLRSRVRRGLQHLSPEHRDVLEHTYGLNGTVVEDPSEMAARLRLSAAEVRRIETAALRMLHRCMPSPNDPMDEDFGMHGIAA